MIFCFKGQLYYRTQILPCNCNCLAVKGRGCETKAIPDYSSQFLDKIVLNISFLSFFLAIGVVFVCCFSYPSFHSIFFS